MSVPARQRLVDPARAVQEGLAHHGQGRLAQAESCYLQGLEVAPHHFDAVHLLGIVALQQGQAVRARELLGRAVLLNPAVAAAHSNLGNALRELGDYVGAVASYDAALLCQPHDAIALSNRGNALFDLQRFDAALESYERALASSPKHAEAHNNRGNALRALGRHPEALVSFERAIALRPDDAAARLNRGNVWQELDRHIEAIADYDNALRLAPALAAAQRQRGISYTHLRALPMALACLDTALQWAPADPDTFNARGNVHRALHDYCAARADYATALRLRPVFAEACFNRAATFDDQRDFGAAAAAYAAVLELQPRYPYAAGLRLHALQQGCEWAEAGRWVVDLVAGIEAGRPVAMPFHAVASVDSPAAHRRVAELWVERATGGRSARQLPPGDSPAPRRPRRAQQKIQVGYFSADFHAHATSYLMAGLVELHDRRRFTITGFSFGPDTGDTTRARMAAAFDHFLDVRGASDAEIASLARKRGIDIAVDLKGFTGDNRFGIFVQRAAPLQVSYLGFPGTSGGAAIDYLVADRTLIPHAERVHYAEKILFMPYSYQVNDATRPIAARHFERRELALPTTGFVFCCFNNAFKITPEVFSAWMRILARVPGSVLWLLADNPGVSLRLQGEAQRRGIDPQRLIFAQRMPVAEHLARQRAADLFLDTAPYNAHTTASDALWAGLPVLTRATRSFAGRVAASLLHAVGLPELVTSSQAEYEAAAIRLATDPKRLRAIAARLAAGHGTAALWNTAAFAQHLERAYTHMVARQAAGLPPEDIEVAALAGPAVASTASGEV